MLTSRQLVKATLIFLVFSIVFSGIWKINPTTAILGDGGDTFEYFAFMHLANENLRNLKHPCTYTNTLRYPNGFDFSYGYDGALAVIFGALLSFFFPSLLSYNFTVVFLLFINLFLSYIAFYKIGSLLIDNQTLGNGESKTINVKAFLCSLIFGVSPFVFARLQSHLNLAFVGGFPVLAYAILAVGQKLFYENSSKISFRNYALVFFGLLLVAMGSLQYIVSLSIFTIIFLLPLILYYESKGTLSDPNTIKKVNTKALLSALLIFSIPFLFFYVGYLKAIFTTGLVEVSSQGKFFMPAFTDFIFPNEYIGSWWKLVNNSSLAIEKVITVGTVELVLILYFFLAAKIRAYKFEMLYLSIFYGFFAIGVMRFPHFYEGGRVVIYISLMLGVFIMLDSAMFSFKHRFSLYMFLAFLVLERLLFNIQAVTNPFPATLYSVRDLPGGAVLNIPVSRYSSLHSALSEVYGKKVVDGYFHYTSDTPEAYKYFADRFFSVFNCDIERSQPTSYNPSNQDTAVFLSIMRERDIRVIVVFKDRFKGQVFDVKGQECVTARKWWEFLNSVTVGILEPKVKSNALVRLDNNNVLNRVRLFFETDGIFVLDGVYGVGNNINTIKIVKNNGDIFIPTWFPDKNGFSMYYPSEEIYVKAGESIFFDSDVQSIGERWLSIFYSFAPDIPENPQKPTLPITLVTEDDKVAVYTVN